MCAIFNTRQQQRPKCMIYIINSRNVTLNLICDVWYAIGAAASFICIYGQNMKKEWCLQGHKFASYNNCKEGEKESDSLYILCMHACATSYLLANRS